MSGQHEQAVEWAQKAIREQPRWAGSYRALASSLAHLGQTEAARSALGQLMEIDPTFSLDSSGAFISPPADGRSSCLGFASPAQPKGIPEPRRALSLSPEELRQFLEPGATDG
jgi:tetratricopeptide (TPR) repeat protein